MALPTALLIKGLAGVGAVAGVVGGGFLIKELLKSEDPNEIIKKLGITGCELGNDENTKTCTLNKAAAEAINFSNKTDSSNTIKITNFDTNKNLTLTIEKLGDDFKTDFPEGLRFTLKHNKDSDLEIGTDTNKITLKKNTDYDFKIKTADDKSLKLEKAWDLTSLVQKVGLSCTGGESTECCTTETSINVWKGETNYKTGATGETGKKITVAKETEGYLEGFKFTVGEESDINLTGGTDEGTTITQLTKNNKAYEIALKDLGSNKGKKWFLVEKSTSS